MAAPQQLTDRQKAAMVIASQGRSAEISLEITDKEAALLAVHVADDGVFKYVADFRSVLGDYGKRLDEAKATSEAMEKKPPAAAAEHVELVPDWDEDEEEAYADASQEPPPAEDPEEA